MPADIDSDLLTLLYDVARHMRTYADRLAQAHGLTRAQHVLLSRLKRRSDVSQSKLAALGEVSPMTIARLIDRLEGLGLVKRHIDSQDRRLRRLQLTSAAGPILNEIQRLVAKLHSIMTKGIDRAILDAMTTGLRQMKENVSNQRLAKRIG
jgi:MarR family transcriptional regulator, transcriptional regulator for hemolysin